MSSESRVCVFCEIVARRAPAHRVAENERALAVLDIQPFSAGHTLVLSKRHASFWHDLSEQEAADVFRLAHRVANRLKRVFSPDFVCLYARGRRIPHTHVFLVPTSSGDPLDRFFNDLERMQETSTDLAAFRRAAARADAARKVEETADSADSVLPRPALRAVARRHRPC